VFKYTHFVCSVELIILLVLHLMNTHGFHYESQPFVAGKTQSQTPDRTPCVLSSNSLWSWMHMYVIIFLILCKFYTQVSCWLVIWFCLCFPSCCACRDACKSSEINPFSKCLVSYIHDQSIVHIINLAKAAAALFWK